jgi:RimJ/RimL family protein N-acetyltransferase
MRRLAGTPRDIADVQRILELAPAYALAVTGRPVAPTEAAETFSERPEGVAAADKVVFAVCADGEMVGVADMVRGYPKPGTAFLGLLVVAGPAQGRGIGRRAVRALEAVARERGCTRIRLAVVRTNDAAAGFWRAMGFSATGEVAPYEAGVVVSECVLFEKELTAARDVTLRPWADGDLGLLTRLLGDPAMMVHLGGPESAEALAARHARYLAADTETNGLFAIVAGHERVGVGWVGFWESEWRGESVWECGWHVAFEWQGRGVARAAAALTIDEAQRRHRHRYMHAFPGVDNAASNALCSSLGFELLGEVQVEYPKGSMMASNDWRLDLGAQRSGD